VSLELILIISLFVLLGLIAFLMLRFVQTKRAALSEEQALQLIARELQETMKELSLQFTKALEDERRLTAQRADGIARTTDALKDGIRELASLTDQRFGEFARSVERHIASLRDTQQSTLGALAKFTEATEKRIAEDRAVIATELDRLSVALAEGLKQFAVTTDRALADVQAREAQAVQRAEEANRALVKEFLGIFERKVAQERPPAPPPAPALAPLASALEQRIARDRTARAETLNRRQPPESGRETFELLAKQPQSAGSFTVELGSASLTRQVMTFMGQKTVTPVEPASQKRPATMDDVLRPTEPVRRAEQDPQRTSAEAGASAVSSGRPESSHRAPAAPPQSSPSAASPAVQQPKPPVAPTVAARPQEPAPPVQKPSIPETPAVPVSAAATASPAVGAVKPVSRPTPEIRPSAASTAPVNREAAREAFKTIIARYTEEWREERKRHPATILNAKQIVGRMADDLIAFKNTRAAVLEPSFIGKMDLLINDAAGLRGFSAATSGAFQEFWKRGDALINELHKLGKHV